MFAFAMCDGAELLTRLCRWYAKGGVLLESTKCILSSPVIKSTIVTLYILGIVAVVKER